MIKEISFKNSRNQTLTGTLWQAPSKALIIMAHGSANNRFAKGLFPQIAEALQKENYNVLSFDFSGHGTSEGDVLTIKKSVDDLASAIAFGKERGYQKIALVGHSLGALTCLEAWTPEVRTMILISALTGPVKWQWDTRLTKEQFDEMQTTGYITVKVNDGLRETLKVDGNLLNDIKAVDQKALLSKITCPVRIIHGNADQDELELYVESKKAMEWLPKSSELKVVDGATHDFLNSSDKARELVKAWLLRYFPLK